MSSSPSRPVTAPLGAASPAPALLEQARILCGPKLREAVGRLAQPMDAIASYHFGWTDAQGNPAGGDGGGKGLRSTLALLSAQAAGAPIEAGTAAGVAVELVHNFSLLHDDLMDGDETRRHRPTVWKEFGAAQAILVGDALLLLAQEVIFDATGQDAAGELLASRAVRRLSTATSRMIAGQAHDLAFEKRDTVTLAECLRMVAGKTGALLGAASSIGAVLAGADSRSADLLQRYGHHLGIAFQAADDLLGIWGEPGVTGKSRWGDLRRRKKSLPVAAAVAQGGSASRQLVRSLADGKDRGSESEEQLALRAELIEAAGGRAWTEREAYRQHATALASLDALELPPGVREGLTALADFVVLRKW